MAAVGAHAFAFLAMAALDFVWARYTHALTARRPARAGVYASAIAALSGGLMVGYATDGWLVVPAVAGAFVGTFIGTER